MSRIWLSEDGFDYLWNSISDCTWGKAMDKVSTIFDVSIFKAQRVTGKGIFFEYLKK